MKFSSALSSYIKSNRVLFTVLILIFFSGLAFGGYIMFSVNEGSVKLIKEYSDSFFSVDVLSENDSASVLLESFFGNFKTVAFIWVSCFFVFLIPITFFAIFIKGLRIGFTVSYLCGLYGLKGFLYAFLNYFSTVILLLPIIMFFSVYCIKNSSKSLRTSKKIFQLNKFSVFAVITIAVLILSLFDGFVMSYILKFISSI